MDQCVSECMKRRRFGNGSFLQIDDRLRVIERISVAWEQVPPDTIRCSWRKSLPIDENREFPIHDTEGKTAHRDLETSAVKGNPTLLEPSCC